MKWMMKEFNELTNEQLYQLLKARIDVFVVEQKCAYPELDNYDQNSLHLFLLVGDEIAANIRILPKNTKYKEVSIGRVLVVEKFRGKGYARAILERGIEFIHKDWKEDKIHIQAQVYLNEFYSSLGFKQISDIYLEDDIPHIDMIWER
ncbi:GNAT family N-acetyltransferase [Oceanobacillus massiliensis]|uniref:GNAT family N-acetyltransferase n=1 Tax=Oceanobacillus massiliensis TaxID=1465765 RepID=UPI000289EB97|nr:GNAT family N-acetyltransferase [Oceanobacillus massiliensis]